MTVLALLLKTNPLLPHKLKNLKSMESILSSKSANKSVTRDSNRQLHVSDCDYDGGPRKHSLEDTLKWTLNVSMSQRRNLFSDLALDRLTMLSSAEILLRITSYSVSNQATECIFFFPSYRLWLNQSIFYIAIMNKDDSYLLRVGTWRLRDSFVNNYFRNKHRQKSKQNKVSSLNIPRFLYSFPKMKVVVIFDILRPEATANSCHCRSVIWSVLLVNSKCCHSSEGQGYSDPECC